MTVDERVSKLLVSVPIEEQLRGREVEEAGKILGLSVPTVYRAISDGRLGHVKVEGRARKGRGHAGVVRIRLLDIVAFQVTNEVMPGAKKVTTRVPS